MRRFLQKRQRLHQVGWYLLGMNISKKQDQMNTVQVCVHASAIACLPASNGRKACFNAAGVRQEGEHVQLLSAAEMAQKSGLFGRKGGQNASHKGHEQAIHCVRCSQPVVQDKVNSAI